MNYPLLTSVGVVGVVLFFIGGELARCKFGACSERDERLYTIGFYTCIVGIVIAIASGVVYLNSIGTPPAL